MRRRASKILFRKTGFGVGREIEMRLMAFTLLAIAVGTGIQFGIGLLPYTVTNTLHGFMTAMFFLSPVIATAGLAYAMRVNPIYAYFAVILVPFVSFALFLYIQTVFLHAQFL
jgi:hypothetical protein